MAKNYLNRDEVNELNPVINMWLGFTKDQVRRRQQVFLHGCQEKREPLLQFNGQGAGTVSKKVFPASSTRDFARFMSPQKEAAHHPTCYKSSPLTWFPILNEP
ncbi:RhuM family protein [Serratia sp. L9]|uniref:RhuM family protein n=1 Tax=Serratia sp. L9 TaxID=3423946 RepID=UPI003D6748AF